MFKNNLTSNIRIILQEITPLIVFMFTYQRFSS
jgi:hypothetical protein